MSHAPTPDPYSGVVQQANDAYQQGMALYSQGDYQQAADAFQRAKLLNPADDPRVDDMLQHTSAVLTPTATPEPATAAPTVQPTAIAQSAATPDTNVSQTYFGQVVLSVVPASDTAPTPATQFYKEDQVALYIPALDQRLRLPFELRVFNADAESLVADVHSDVTAAEATAVSTPATPRPTGSGQSVVQFWNHFVWYHSGGEAPGHYHVELYAADTLAYVADYAVLDTPLPLPTATPVVVPTDTPVAAPTDVPMPAAVPQPPAVAQPAPISQPQVAPTAVPVPTPVPLPTPVPAAPIPTATPAPTNVAYVVDSSNVLWHFDQSTGGFAPLATLPGKVTGVAGDPAGETVFVAVASPDELLAIQTATGQQLAGVQLPSTPGQVRFDAVQGELLVVLPDLKQLAAIDVGSMTVSRTIALPAGVSAFDLNGDI